MAETPNRGYPYPGVNDAPDGPFAFEQLATDIDTDVEGIATDVESLKGRKHSEWTFNSPAANSGTNWGAGALGNVAAVTTDVDFVDSPSSDVLEFNETGWYAVSVDAGFRNSADTAANPTTGRAYVQMVVSGRSWPVRRSLAIGEDQGGASAPNLYMTAGTTISFQFYTTTGGSQTKFKGRINVTKWPE